MSDERGTMINGHDRIAGLVETMQTTADGYRPTACGRREPEGAADSYIGSQRG
jgi:hypothetical protein